MENIEEENNKNDLTSVAELFYKSFCDNNKDDYTNYCRVKTFLKYIGFSITKDMTPNRYLTGITTKEENMKITKHISTYINTFISCQIVFGKQFMLIYDDINKISCLSIGTNYFPHFKSFHQNKLQEEPEQLAVVATSLAFWGDEYISTYNKYLSKQSQKYSYDFKDFTSNITTYILEVYTDNKKQRNHNNLSVEECLEIIGYYTSSNREFLQKPEIIDKILEEAKPKPFEPILPCLPVVEAGV